MGRERLTMILIVDNQRNLEVMLKVGKSIEIQRENLTARRGAAQFLDPRGTNRIWNPMLDI